MTAKRVLLVGGAGVFGERLARGLSATGADVIIAGRDLRRAEAACAATRAHSAAALNRLTATAADIQRLSPDLVIDAAGPYQGADLSFARAVIAAGCDYIDLADARDFLAAFPTLEPGALTAKVRAFAGASSTPALSHAVLEELTRGWLRIDVVRIGISPGNRAPRGRAVIESILSWAGGPVRVFEGGRWRTRPGWRSEARRALPGLGRRRFALSETPDLDLVPARFKVREEALFMAGLELGLLHHGLGLISGLRRIGLMRDLRPLAPMLQWLAMQTTSMGADRGGMFIEAFGRDAEDKAAHAEWTLFAPAGVGPYVPTLPALAIARRLLAGEAIAPGARAAVGVIALGELAEDFERHGITTAITRTALVGPFEAALGPAFDQLPEVVRASHRAGPISRYRGEARVAPATGLGWLLARPFGFPAGQSAAPVEVEKRITGPCCETWTRTIGKQRFRSRIACLGPGRVSESFGPFTFTLALEADAERHTMRTVGWRLGPAPLPHWLAPRSVARESVSPTGRFAFDVPIDHPLAGRLTHYKGELRAVDPDPATDTDLR